MSKIELENSKPHGGVERTGEGAFPPTPAEPAQKGERMKLAVDTEHVEFLLQNDVAIVIKKPIYINVGCGARTRAIFKSPFTLRGGVKLLPAREKIDEYEVILK
ncbi:MAG: hypothetical protein ACO2O0_06640, partial [Desulfurococcales archaeon]